MSKISERTHQQIADEVEELVLNALWDSEKLAKIASTVGLEIKPIGCDLCRRGLYEVRYNDDE
tara:strand:- start:301 stop:489 length:189 start_codon:yes stop_codon:yes gene_type:complete